MLTKGKGVILVNNEHRIVDSGVVPLSLSDHSLVYCRFRSVFLKPPRGQLNTGYSSVLMRLLLIRRYFKLHGTLLTMKPMLMTLF